MTAAHPLPAGLGGPSRRLMFANARNSSAFKPVMIGLLIGAGLILSAGLSVTPFVAAFALLSLVAAVLAPPVGLAVLAATVSLQDIDLFRPFGFVVVLVMALVAGTFVREVVARPRSGPSILTFLAGGYLAMAAITLLPAVSGLDYDSTTGALYELLQMASILAAVAVARNVFRTTDARGYLWLGLLSGVVAVSLALVLIGTSSDAGLPFQPLFGLGEETNRATGPFNDPNYFGLYLSVAAMVALALARASDGWHRWVAIALAVAFGAAIVLTYSRGALLALAVGIALTVLLISRRATIALAGLLLVGLLVGEPIYLATRLSITTGGIYAQPYTSLAASDAIRSDAFQAGMRLVEDSPIFGNGFGQFRFRAERYVGGNPTAYPHNSWIKILAEQGIVGAIAFAAMIIAGVVTLLRVRHGRVGPVIWPALVTFGVGATFLEPLVSLQTSGLLAISLGAALAAADATRLVEPTHRARWPPSLAWQQEASFVAPDSFRSQR